MPLGLKRVTGQDARDTRTDLLLGREGSVRHRRPVIAHKAEGMAVNVCLVVLVVVVRGGDDVECVVVTPAQRPDLALALQDGSRPTGLKIQQEQLTFECVPAVVATGPDGGHLEEGMERHRVDRPARRPNRPAAHIVQREDSDAVLRGPELGGSGERVRPASLVRGQRAGATATSSRQRALPTETMGLTWVNGFRSKQRRNERKAAVGQERAGTHKLYI
jgi:hypothetical protein